MATAGSRAGPGQAARSRDLTGSDTACSAASGSPPTNTSPARNGLLCRIRRVSRRLRAAIAACWLVVAFLILRMLWGGSLFGIVYVIHHDHPAVLIADALTIVVALVIAVLLAIGATIPALRLSIVLSYLTILFSFVLATQDHGSAPVVGAAALIALALARRTVQVARSGSSPPAA